MLKSMLITTLLFFGLNDVAHAESTTYQSAVGLYKDGALTDAVQLFETSSFSKDPEIRKKSLYMMGSIYTAQKTWGFAMESFSTIVKEFPQDSYADDAQYWIAKIVMLKGSGWDADSVPYFKQVYQDYPNGDKAPDAYYMAIRQSRDGVERQTLFKELVAKFPEHSIIDDASLHLYSDDGPPVAEYLSKSIPKLQNKIAQCRLDFVIGRLYNDAAEKKRYFKSASKCTEESDFHLDLYLHWVYSFTNTKQFDEANRIAGQFKQTYVNSGVYDKDYEVYSRMLHGIAVYSNYTENTDEVILFDYTTCEPSGLEYAKNSFQTCHEYMAKTGTDPFAQEGTVECFDDYLRYSGCMFYTNRLTAGDMMIQSKNYGFSSSNFLTILELAAKKGDRAAFAEIKGNIVRASLPRWEQSTYDELVQGM